MVWTDCETVCPTRWHILHYRLCNWLLTIFTGGVEGSGYCSPAMSLYNYDFPVNFYFIWPVFFFWWLLQLWPCLQGNVKENRGGLPKPIYLQAGRLQGTVDWDWFGSEHQTSLSRSATVPFQWILHVRGSVCCHPSGMRRCWWRSIVTWILCIMLNNNNNNNNNNHIAGTCLECLSLLHNGTLSMFTRWCDHMLLSLGEDIAV